MNDWIVAGLLVTVTGGTVLPVTWEKVLAVHVGALLCLVGYVVGPFTPNWTLASACAVYAVSIGISTLLSKQRRMSLLPRPNRGDGALTALAYLVNTVGASGIAKDLHGTLLAIFVVVVALTCGLGMLQAFGNDLATRAAFMVQSGIKFRHRAIGLSNNPVFFGGLVVLVLPAALMMALKVPEFVPILWLVSIGLALSGTRAAWAGGLFVFGATAPAMFNARDLWIPASAIALALWSLYLVNKQEGAEVALDHPGSFSGRITNWGYCFQRALARPWFGWGNNTLAQAELDSPGFYFENAHNELLEVANNHGLVGLASYVGIVAVAFAASVHAAPVFAITILGYAIYAMFGWSHVGPANLWWVMLGLAGGVAHGS